MSGNTPLGRMVIDLDMNDTKFNSSVTGLKRQMKLVDSAIQANLSGMGKYGSEAGRLGTRIEGLTKKHEVQERIVREQQEAYKKVAAEKGENSKEAELLASKLNKEEAALSDITNELKEMEKQHKVMTSPWTRLGNELDDYGNKLTSIGNGIKDVGKVGTKWITAPALALGTVGVKSAMDYEASMSNVRGLLNATDEDMAKLDKSAKEWGGSTSYSAKEVADAFGYMSLAGWDVEQQTEAIGSTLKFTEATGLDLAHGTDLVTDSMGALRLETKDLDGYLDSLVATQSNSNTTAEEMMQAYIGAGSTMSAMNFTVDETNAMLGVLADNGIKGSEAGTKLNSMFAKLVNPTGQTAKAFEELDISMANADGTMKSSDEILAEIKAKTEGLTESEQNRYIAMIAGTENLSAMNTLLDASGGKLEEYQGINEEANGSLDELHTIMKDNLKGDLENFTSSLEAAALSLGEMLLPYVRELVEWMTDVVDKFNDMPDSTKGTIVAIGGIAAAIPPLLVGFGGFMTLTGKALKILSPLALAIGKNGGLIKVLGSAFKLLMGPIGIAVTIIGLLVTAFIKAYNNSDTFREKIHSLGDKVKEIWEHIKGFGEAIVELFKGNDGNASDILSQIGIKDDTITKILDFRDRLVDIKDRILEVWDNAKTLGEGIFELFQGNSEGGFSILSQLGIEPETIKDIMDFRDKAIELKDRIIAISEDILSKVRPAFEEVVDFIGGLIETIREMWDSNSATIIPTVTNIANVIADVFNGILAVVDFIMPAVYLVIEMVWNNIKGVIDGGLRFIDGIIKVFTGIFTGDFSRVWEGIKKIFSGGIEFVWNLFQLMFYGRIIKGVGALVKGFGSAIKGLWTKVSGFFKGMVDDAAVRVLYMRDTVVKFIRQLATGVRDRISVLVSRVREFFGNMRDGAVNRVSNMRDRVVDFISSLRSRATDLVSRLVNRVKTFFGNMRDNAVNRISNMRDRVVSFFSNLRERASDIVNRLRQRVVDTFRNLRDSVVNRVSNLRDRVVSFFSNLRERVSDTINRLKDRITGLFRNIYDGVTRRVRNLRDNVVNRFSNMRERVQKAVQNLRDRLQTYFETMKKRATDMFTDMVDAAKKLPGRIKNALVNMKGKAVDGIKSMGNSMLSQLEKVINGLIKGLNKVTDKIGITATVSEVSLPRFSKGTMNGAIAQDTLATVGDRGPGNGKGTRELVQYPNGTAGLYDNDATIFAPKGTIIYNNRQTEKIISSLPRFSAGTGSGTKNGNNKKEKKGLLGTFKDVLSNTWDYIKNPGKALDAIISNIVPDFSGLKGFAKTAAKGGFGFIKDKALDFITGIFKDSEGGEVNGKGILGRAITARFGNYPPSIARQLGVTKHYGLDTAHKYESLTSPVSGKVTRVWHDKFGGNAIQVKAGQLNWWFMHMQSIAKKVGDIVKAGKTKLGVTGNTGLRTTGYHLHTQAMKGGIGNSFAINPLPLLKKGGYATGGLVGNGLYHLGEEGYPEWIIPTDPKRRTDAMKLMAHAGRALQQNGGNLRPNNLPNLPEQTDNSDIKELKSIVANQQTQLEQNNQMIALLTQIVDKEYVALYNEKQMARDLAPELSKRSQYNATRDARFS